MFNFLQHINTSRHVTSPKHETNPITSAAAAVVVVAVVIPGNRVGRVEYLEAGFLFSGMRYHFSNWSAEGTGG